MMLLNAFYRRNSIKRSSIKVRLLVLLLLTRFCAEEATIG